MDEQPQQPTPPQSEPAPMKHSHAGVIISIIVIAAILLGGAAYAFFGTSLFAPKDPYVVMDEMFEVLAEVDTVQSTVSLNASADVTPIMAAEAAALAEYEREMTSPSTTTPPTTSFGFMSDSYIPRPDTTFTDLGVENLKVAVSASFFGNSETGEDARQTGMFEIDSPIVAATLNYHILGTALYLQLADFSATVPGEVAFPVDMFVAPYLGTWIGITQEEVEEFIPVPLPMYDEEDEGDGDIEEEIEAVRTAFATHRPLILTEMDGFDGQYTYGVDLDLPAMEAFLTEVSTLLDEPEIRSKQEIKEMMDSLRELEENELFEDMDLVLAIDKDTMLPVSMSFVGTVTPPAEEMPYEVEGVVVNVDFGVVFNQYNAPVEVSAPADALTIEELMMQFMAGMGIESDMGMMMEDDMSMMSDYPSDPAGGADSDGDGIPDVVEEQLGSDPLNPDTDGDGFDDFMEVSNGYDPLN